MNLFLIILDGCSNEAIQRASIPFLDEVEKFSSVIQAAIPTATYTGHASILCGSPPNQHGIVGNQFLDRKTSEIKNFDVHDVNELVHGKTLFESLPNHPGASICEPITRGASYVKPMAEFNQQPGEQRNELIFQELLLAMKKESLELFVVNFSGIDYMGETHGEKSKQYFQAISEVDEYIQKIFSSISGEAIFIITADHGMTSAGKNFDVNSFLLESGIENATCLPTHRACHVYIDPTSKQDAMDSLRSSRVLEVVADHDSLAMYDLDNERSGDIVAFARKGYELGEEKLKGSHGGLDDLEREVPFMIFSKNKPIDFVQEQLNGIRSTADIYSLIMKLFQNENEK
ncbi:MAG: alkaline phosphatase family protein [Candidatus Helarchaeales archaeon]